MPSIWVVQVDGFFIKTLQTNSLDVFGFDFVQSNKVSVQMKLDLISYQRSYRKPFDFTLSRQGRTKAIQSRYNSSMQDTTTTVTSQSASNASGTIAPAKVKSKSKSKSKSSKTKSTDVFTISSKGAVQTTNTILGAAKLVKNFRAAGSLPTEIEVNKNGRVLGWASFASMVSVKRKQNALANASKPKAPKAQAGAESKQD